jgi:hypothetical protein
MKTGNATISHEIDQRIDSREYCSKPSENEEIVGRHRS